MLVGKMSLQKSKLNYASIFMILGCLWPDKPTDIVCLLSDGQTAMFV